MKHYAIPLLAILAMSSMASPEKAWADARELQIMVPNGPPQAMDPPVNGQRGLMAEIALEATKRAGFSGKLNFQPWSRGQQEASEGKDILISGLSRIPSREGKYTWIYSVFNMGRAFATSGKVITSFDQAKDELKSIAVGVGTAQLDLLKTTGFADGQIKPIALVGLDEPQLILRGRYDAWFNTIPELQWRLKGYPDAAKIIIGPPLQQTQQFIACSKDCSSEIADGMKTALEAMRADGTIDKIMAEYK